MGAIYSREILHVANPRVGLLSIGEEDTKGNELTKEVFKEMRGINLNFIGNVEGRDIFNGTCDVIVCDGFTGNVSLKAIESVAEMLMVFLRKELQSSLMARAGTMLAYPALRRFKRTIDYAEYGGFPLLGVKGSVIICHGRSSPKAIKNAIRACAEAIEAKVNDRIHEIMARETASLAPAEV
jgi:glycerol-3-phosphate acyltransferase PlsX